MCDICLTNPINNGKKMILAIDSSSLVASVALAEENSVVAQYTMNLKKTHSQTLLPMIDEIFRMTGVEHKQIRAIAVTKGPGSFTGLRIGAATAKGLAFAWNVPIVGVSTIEMMAYNYNYCNKLICPIMDARRGQVYTGIFECPNEKLHTVLADTAITIDELMEQLQKIDREVIFVGDGIPVYQEILDEKLTVAHYFSRAHLSRQQASSLAMLGWDQFKQGMAVAGDSFAPGYMRLSQAERERMENDQENGKK